VEGYRHGSIRQFRKTIRNYREEGRRGEEGVAADATTYWSAVNAALPVRTILYRNDDLSLSDKHTKNRHQLEAVSNFLGWCRSAPVNATNATAGATSDSSTTLGTINETSSGRGRVRTLAAEPRLKRSRTWRGVIEEEESADQLVDGVDIGAIEAIAEKIARTLATDNAARAAAANAAATADADDDGELLGQTPGEPKAEFLQDLDMNGDGIVDAEGYDTTNDGVIDSLDTTFDGKIDTRLVANSSS
jgi:hypothetical protein